MSKKVAIVSAVFPPYRGGIGTVAFNQARVLASRGADVTVLVPDYARTTPARNASRSESGGPNPSSLHSGGQAERRGFKIELLKPILKYGNAAWVPGLKKRLKDFNVVILQYPFFGGMRAVYKAKKKYGFKLIVNYNMDVVATLRQGFGWSSSLKGLVFWYATKFFLARIINIADVVIASSEDYAKHSDLGKYWDNNPPARRGGGKFKVLPIGVDITKFKPAEPEEEFRKNLNIRPDEKIVLFVGGLDKAHYFKGVEYLIKAVALLRHPERSEGSQGLPRDPSTPLRSAQDDGGFKLVIAGRGELQDKYRALAQELGVKDRVLFTGGVSDDYLVKLFQMAYVTVLPSIDQSESFGIVLVESLSCGTPVIASDLPGVRSVFENEVSGFAVPPRDIEALAERIKHILDNPEKARAMGQAGRKLTEEKYDWQAIGDKLFEIILN